MPPTASRHAARFLVLILVAASASAALTAAPAAAGPTRPAARFFLAVEGPLAPKPKGGQFPLVEGIEDEEADQLLDALKTAEKSKETAAIVAALEPLVVKRHEDFADRLKKLVGDDEEAIAAKAAEALGSQADAKAGAVLAKVLRMRPKKGFLPQPRLLAAAIESLGRLDITGAYDRVMAFAVDMTGDERQVRSSYADDVLGACVRYFGLTKEKRAVSFLIGQFGRPEPDDPNSGTNPPAEFWEARHKTWRVVLPEVEWALKEITGLEQETQRRWESWFEEEGEKAGMK